jgi:hypothetical protein
MYTAGSPVCRLLVQDVGRVGPGIGAEVVDAGRGRELGEVRLQLLFRVAPGEVGVALREAQLREPVHHLRPGEGFGQEDRVGVLALHFADDPLPEREGLGVRVVHAEDAHALPDPVVEHALEFGPEAAPVLALEVERVDVLVLLGRVLRVLHGAVGAPAEPVGVRLHVRVVGRALKGDVERDLQPVVGRAREQVPKVFFGAERRQDRLVPALGRADGPGAAHVVGAGLERVVRPLALHAADGMDRREIQHVEAHFGNGGQARLHVAEGAVHAGLGRRPSAERVRTRC